MSEDYSQRSFEFEGVRYQMVKAEKGVHMCDVCEASGPACKNTIGGTVRKPCGALEVRDGWCYVKAPETPKAPSVDPGPGYRLLEDDEEVPEGAEGYVPSIGGRPEYWFKVPQRLIGSRWGRGVIATCRTKLPEPQATGADRVDAKIQELKGAIEANLTPDPKTKYIRDIYPVDGTTHTDANGKQFVRIDVYSVLRAFGVDHPTGHAVKKLLCAGMRGKGDRIQDLTEAKVAIDRAIQEAGI